MAVLIGRSLQFNRIPFRVLYVDRRTVPVSPITGLDLAANHIVLRKVPANRLLVEGFHADTEMVDVSTLFPGRRATHTPQFAVDRNDIYQCVTRAQLNQPQFGRRLSFDNTAQDVAIKRDHRAGIPSAQYDMVEFWIRIISGILSRRLSRALFRQIRFSDRQKTPTDAIWHPLIRSGQRHGKFARAAKEFPAF